MKQSNVVADYMMIEHDKISQDFNPATMEGYKYIFHGEEAIASLLATAPEYRVECKEETRIRTNILFQREKTIKCTTIDSVWRRIESQSFLTREDVETTKVVMLSFSLFNLLKRRLCGYPIGEAGVTKTLDFVLHGLISE